MSEVESPLLDTGPQKGTLSKHNHANDSASNTQGTFVKRIRSQQRNVKRAVDDLNVMVLYSNGDSELVSITRSGLLQLANEYGRRLSVLPFGEVKMRDLRTLDPNLSFGSNSKLLPRTLCIMVNLNPVSAFITPDRIYVIIENGADSVLQLIRSQFRAVIDPASSSGTDEDNFDGEDTEPIFGPFPNILQHADGEAAILPVESSQAIQIIPEAKEGPEEGDGHLLSAEANVEGLSASNPSSSPQPITGSDENDEDTSSGDSDDEGIHEEAPISAKVANSSETGRSVSPGAHTEGANSNVANFGDSSDAAEKELEELDQQLLERSRSLRSPSYVKSARRGGSKRRYPSVSPRDHTVTMKRPVMARDTTGEGPGLLQHVHAGYAEGEDVPFQHCALGLIFDVSASTFKKEVDMLMVAKETVKTVLQANELLMGIQSLRAKIVGARDEVEEFVSDEKEISLMSFDSIIQNYGTGMPHLALDNHDGQAPNGVRLVRSQSASSKRSLLSEIQWKPYEVDLAEASDLCEDYISRLDDALNELELIKFAVEELNSNLRHVSDIRKDRLLKCWVRIQAVTCLTAPSTLIASLFGMNLHSGLETEDTTGNFWTTFAFCMGLFLVGMLIFVIVTHRFFQDLDDYDGSVKRELK